MRSGGGVVSRYRSSEAAARQAVAARATALRVKLWTVPRAHMGAAGLRASGQNSTRHGLRSAAYRLAMSYLLILNEAFAQSPDERTPHDQTNLRCR